MIATRSKLGLVFAVVFFIVNFGGAIYAAAVREPMHCLLHVALLMPSVWLLRRYAPRRVAGVAEAPQMSDHFPDRLTNLEQSIDAVAIEVERIGEGQRAMTDLLVDDQMVRAPSQATAQRSEAKPDRSTS